jgi:hypothetical protein
MSVNSSVQKWVDWLAVSSGMRKELQLVVYWAERKGRKLAYKMVAQLVDQKGYRLVERKDSKRVEKRVLLSVLMRAEN